MAARRPIGVPVASAGLLACAALVACAPKMHAIEPYQSDPVAAAELEARARDLCDAQVSGAPPPDQTFITDGCTAWFNRDWGGCCVEHDIAYWCGGSREDRKRADRELRSCVEGFTSRGVAQATYLGVRVGGHPIFPVHFRWGFGRSYCPWYGESDSSVDEAATP